MSEPGGWCKPRPATAKDQAIADKVKDQFKTMSGTDPGPYKVVSTIARVTIDTSYFFEINTYLDFIHLHVLDPPPDTNEGPKLLSFKMNMKKGDKLGDC